MPESLRNWFQLAAWYGSLNLENQLLYDEITRLWHGFKPEGYWVELSKEDYNHLVYDGLRNRRETLTQQLQRMGQFTGAAIMGRPGSLRVNKEEVDSGLRIQLARPLPKPALEIIGTPEGMVNLRTGESFPHNPAHNLRASTAVNPGKGPIAVQKRIASEYFGKTMTPPNFNTFCRQLGLTLSGESQSHHPIALLKGPQGSGKGHIIHTVRTAFGSYALTASDALLREPHGGPDGEGATLIKTDPRFLMHDEIFGSGADRTSEGRLNRLTGGNEISAKPLYINTPVYGVPHFTIWSASVDVPRWQLDGGIGRRLTIIETSGELQESDKHHNSKVPQEVLEALVAIAIDEARKYYEEEAAGRYIAPQGDPRTLAQLKQTMDPHADWIANAGDLHGVTIQSALARCQRETGADPISSNLFSRKLRRTGIWWTGRPTAGEHRTTSIIYRDKEPIPTEIRDLEAERTKQEGRAHTKQACSHGSC